MLVAIAGLPASGKTAIGKSLEKKGFRLLTRDIYISLLFNPVNFSSREQKDIAFKVMIMVAEYYLTNGEKVVLDCPSFSQEWAVNMAKDIALKVGASFKMIYCDCPEDVAIKRIKNQKNHIATDRTPDLYKKVKARFEPIKIEYKIIHTDRPLSETMEEVNEYINRIE